jgi:hypothetical protein
MASSGSLKPPSLANSKVLWASFCSRALSLGGVFGGLTFSVGPSMATGSGAGSGRAASAIAGAWALRRPTFAADGSGRATVSLGFGVRAWLSASAAVRRSSRERPRL